MLRCLPQFSCSANCWSPSSLSTSPSAFRLNTARLMNSFHKWLTSTQFSWSWNNNLFHGNEAFRFQMTLRYERSVHNCKKIISIDFDGIQLFCYSCKCQFIMKSLFCDLFYSLPCGVMLVALERQKIKCHSFWHFEIINNKRKTYKRKVCSRYYRYTYISTKVPKSNNR